MKLCKLKLKNLNSFRRPVEIDFENPPLDDASLVAITGSTGSGKTTLLDAICIALYGKTPRLSGTGSQHPRHLISHGETDGFAEVHFEANGTRYIAVWSIKRGSTAEVRLSNAEDGKLISDKLSGKGKSLGSSQRTVSEEVESLLGLDFDAFKRSVMLAQGEFAAFLKASNEERRKILEATAGIQIYDVLRQALLDKVKEVQKVYDEIEGRLGQIPVACPKQLEEAEVELERLEKEANEFSEQGKRVQAEKTGETKRKEDFEKLQSLENRQDELINQQPEIDTLQVERKNAERAERLRSEKQAFDTAKSELKDAEKALHIATSEKTEVEKQVVSDQVIIDEKQTAFQTVSDERDRKIPIYTDAKSDVERAADQFAEAEKRVAALADLDDEIGILSDQLTDREVEQTELQEQIKNARTFLDENRLPSDRQHRLNRANVLAAQLDLQQTQLEIALASEMEHGEKISSLEQEIKELSETREGRLAEKMNAEKVLETATDELNILLASGTRAEWDARKKQATEAQPVAQRYETVKGDLANSEDSLRGLNKAKADLDAELKRIEAELVSQAEVCQQAEKAVERCEEARELVLLANPINKLRQHLHTGEPCLVCGATDHPYVDIEEPEGDNLLQNAENALKHMKSDAQTAQEQLQSLSKRQIQIQQNRDNSAEDIDECAGKIERLRDQMTQLLVQWQEIHPDVEVSSTWITEQIKTTDTAIAAIGTAEKTHTDASHSYQTATQQFENCEKDLERERESLTDSEKKLQNVIDAVEDLKKDIASTENSFWDLVPAAFHGVSPQEAKDQFSDKIDEVATRKDELNTAETSLKILDAEIKTDQVSLKTLRKNRGVLQTEIDRYRRDGEGFLKKVREKTDGLKTEAEINTAIDKLDAELKAKEGERDGAQHELQISGDLLTQKQTTHEIREKRCEECSEKFETARVTYFDKLDEAGFDSSEAHESAFRDEAQSQALTDHIEAHDNEKHQLALKITELRTVFRAIPFDPKALGRIETEAEKIGADLQTAQQEVGAQQQIIDDLKDALKRREALGAEIAAAEAELMRWTGLQDTIPQNALRDFALEIMFKQMGSLANEQLNYLTSERYQLKVETIGNLTVIDRWNANEERPVETLSGGESFLTSLALALALADLSRGRAQLNSLFLDEGFGTLDTETLDIAIAALEGLRMQGRSIFLISHVQELTRRLPVKINVRKHGDNSLDSLDSSYSSSIEIRG